MNTSEFLQKINTINKPLNFTLFDGEQLSGDLHITEIKNVHVDSTDCGGNQHSYNETVIQLWQNERMPKTAIWNTKKVRTIAEVVESKMKLNEDTELFIEFGNSVYRTSVHKVKWLETDDEITLQLVPISTQCKPASLSKLACC